MKSKKHLGSLLAVLACVAALAAIAIAPASASAAATSCGNKNVKIPVEGGKATHVLVKAITVEGGATCAEAVKVISGTLAGKPPAGWKSVAAHFKLPKALEEEGLFPALVKKGGKKVKFAIHGG
jgi:hypothetical protein